MSDDALQAWLGPAADELTREQVSILEGEQVFILQRWPDARDDAWERDEALATAVQWLLGETTAEIAVVHLDTARLHLRQAMVIVGQIARMEVLYRGRPEAETARLLHLDRMTVRKMLGK